MITYRGKTYEFPEGDGAIAIPKEQLATLPKGVLLLLLAGAERGSFSIANDALTHLTGKMGKYLTDGDLNRDGQRVFQNDRELMVALRTSSPTAHAPATTPVLGESGAGSSENTNADIADSNANTASDTATDARENADASTNSTSLPSSASKASDDVPRIPNLAHLLSGIHQFLLRYMVFPEPAQAIAVAIWITHTWVFDAFRFTPYLHVYSPTKRCGKSLLLDCLKALVCRPWLVVLVTEAVIMRKVDAEKPTLLFDEIDAVFRSSRDKSKEAMRGLINSGFMSGSKVPRCAGAGYVDYSVYCPKALAGIGDGLPDTVKDRCIRIQLFRRTKDQKVEKFNSRDVEELTKEIVEGLASWAGDEQVIQQLQSSRPAIPDELGDRAADFVEPLLAIADMAGGEWPEVVRSSLVTLLQANDEEEADEPGVRLLSAIRDIFATEQKKQMPTIQILRRLADREEEEEWTLQWPRLFRGGNTRGPAARMATLLRPYKISAGTIRLPDGRTPKGYRIEAFSDAFTRYLSHISEKVATTPQDAAQRVPQEPIHTEESNDGSV